MRISSCPDHITIISIAHLPGAQVLQQLARPAVGSSPGQSINPVLALGDSITYQSKKVLDQVTLSGTPVFKMSCSCGHTAFNRVLYPGILRNVKLSLCCQLSISYFLEELVVFRKCERCDVSTEVTVFTGHTCPYFTDGFILFQCLNFSCLFES